MSTLRTPAKINLGLEILRQRSNGYHDLNSVFLPIPLFDEITFDSTAGGIECVCDTHTLPSNESNLCVRAAIALRNHAGIEQGGVRIALHKRIPVGAGLGGGSSDAACTLLALNGMWEINASQSELHTIAISVGADVPFFLAPTQSIVRGIGDEIIPIKFPLMLHLLLVCPKIHIHTAWAYDEVVCDPSRPATDYEHIIPRLNTIHELAGIFRNDFEPFLFPHHPELSAIKDRLRNTGAVYAAMSGSGSAMFGIFESATHAEVAKQQFVEYDTYVCEV